MQLAALYGALKQRLSACADDPALEARWLLQHFLNLKDADILDGSQNVEPPQALDQAVTERLSGMPLSKVLGIKAFYGRAFRTNTHVLDPRADSETLIEAALALPHAPQSVLELGVGSGCLITTLLAEWPHAQGTGVDLSARALETTLANARAHGVAPRLTLVQSNWLESLPAQKFDLILSNPPYIPTHEIETLDVAVKHHDPLLALDGGASGLTAYETLLKGLKPYCTAHTNLLFEIGAGQEADVAKLAETNGFALKAQHRDLGGHIRVLHFLLA